jgi:hypothetical protein
MKILVTTSQLQKLKKPKTMVVQVNESQLKKLKKIKLGENTELYSLVTDVDNTTSEVKLVDLETKNIMIITKLSDDPDEPKMEDLIGKKRGEIIKIKKNGEETNYTITTITNRITKNTHQNFDEISSIDELIIKLKSDPYFQNSSYAPKKQTYVVLEILKNKGEAYNRRIMQIFYLLFRRSGSIKKFETKLNRFIPFMKLLLSKGDQFFDCITSQLELALENTNEKQLSEFASSKSNFENLISYIKKIKVCDKETSIKFESIFKTQEFSKYEKEFLGSHFDYAPTSMSINLSIKNLENFDSGKFHTSTNLIKMQMMLTWILKNSKVLNGNLLLNDATNNLVNNLEISFPEKTKRDLVVVQTVYGLDEQNKEKNLLNVGDNIEVKLKKYSNPDFLCEFFKPESHNSTMEYLVNSLMKINKNINSSVEVTKIIGILNSAIVEKITKSDLGIKVINDIKNTTKGIIFKDYKFVDMNDIDLFWTDTGYANKPRIAIQYSVREDAKIYTLKIDNTDKEQLTKVYWTE